MPKDKMPTDKMHTNKMPNSSKWTKCLTDKMPNG